MQCWPLGPRPLPAPPRALHQWLPIRTPAYRAPPTSSGTPLLFPNCHSRAGSLSRLHPLRLGPALGSRHTAVAGSLPRVTTDMEAPPRAPGAPSPRCQWVSLHPQPGSPLPRSLQPGSVGVHNSRCPFSHLHRNERGPRHRGPELFAYLALIVRCYQPREALPLCVQELYYVPKLIFIP